MRNEEFHSLAHIGSNVKPMLNRILVGIDIMHTSKNSWNFLISHYENKCLKMLPSSLQFFVRFCFVANRFMSFAFVTFANLF